ncbi:MAG: hypothetical protein RI884_2914, partial [Pseudomonadota bacterium]
LPIRALILTPTRELAAQVEESVRVYGKYSKLSSMVMFGGVGMQPQIDKLRRGVDILVATPGRLLDHHQQRTVDLSQVEIFVLDEADRMLDMGFIHDIKKVLAVVPAKKQSLLFSATFSDEIKALADRLLNQPVLIEVARRNSTAELVAQKVHPVGRDRKKALLSHLIRSGNWHQVLVFTRMKHGANRLAEFLNDEGITAMAIHGNKSQGARTKALSEFKTGDLQVLVATDIAARGIDIDQLPHVVNFEIPNVPEDYVHRIGRTGRAGNSGEAVSLVCLDEEGFLMEIERFTKQQIPREPVEGFGPEPDERAEPIAMGRQTIWGGAGKPPSREVMAAAAKAARSEMMQRIRDNKAAGGGNGGGRGGQKQSAGPKQGGGGRGGNGNGGRQTQGQGQGRNGGGRPPQHQRLEDGEAQPRMGAHQSGSPFVLREATPVRSKGDGQPDPLRTSVDSMGGRGRRGGGGGGGGRGFGGGGGGGGRSGGSRNWGR